MQAQFHHSIEEIDPNAWNRLVRDENPFLKHEFHAALERNNCVGPQFGWLPRHLTVSQGGRIIGISPLYIKSNSYGEFVFDHTWADAYQRNGLRYYPKLISAIPYTPALGERLLVDPEVDTAAVRYTMVTETLRLARELDLSSMHWLFTTGEEGELLKSAGMMERLGVQFHWDNPGYGDFDDFLSTLTAKRRKNIRRERRKVSEAGITFRVVHGPEVTEAEWRVFSDFYAKTFEERYSLPTLNNGFFQEIGKSLGNQVILVLAYEAEQCVAGALLYRGASVLYGRHWGGVSNHDSLHFEACYYQGIEYAIAKRIGRFEPGAQGEHKIWRGFLPVLTRSYHWIADPQFSVGIASFLHRESQAILEYKKTLQMSSPYSLGRDG
ncbi:MAG: GNAT family N-acetyltransferase [Candidatus Thiodiazotropha sp. (ex Myrtea sp. 'scaly one' KF741663)]|nr:GNAT family N-acetyltransferase [Candidatus Thiodiazotropha sp. (ex Myrtea sp. 'scaly one' KF741663)]